MCNYLLLFILCGKIIIKHVYYLSYFIKINNLIAIQVNFMCVYTVVTEYL